MSLRGNNRRFCFISYKHNTYFHVYRSSTTLAAAGEATHCLVWSVLAALWILQYKCFFSEFR
jgi:hypothetical protein